MVEQLRDARPLAEALPGLVSRGGDIDIAVSGLVHACPGPGRMVIALLAGDHAAHQVARRLEVEHVDLRFDQRSRNPLALAGALAVEQRSEERRVGKESRPGWARDR